MDPAPRLVPEEPFPPYSFVPGKSPHPFSDPAGHSHGRDEPSPPAVEPERWQQSKTYLYALDLFNGGFYWESHVQLEALWIAAGRRGPAADFLKALIKLAAAGVKHREGKRNGVESHARRAADLLRGVAPSVGPAFLGLPLKGLIELAEEVGRQGWPDPVPLLLPAVRPPPL